MTKKLTFSMIASAVLCIVFGLILVIFPATARQIICYILGGLMLLFGAYCIISYFVHKIEFGGLQFGLAIGIACALVGLFLLIKTDMVIQVLEMIVGIAVIVDSVIRLQLAINIKRADGAFWKPMLICALCTLVIGALLLFNPFTTLQVATIVAGVALIIDGILSLWTAIECGIMVKKATTPRVN